MKREEFGKYLVTKIINMGAEALFFLISIENQLEDAKFWITHTKLNIPEQMDLCSVKGWSLKKTWA